MTPNHPFSPPDDDDSGPTDAADSTLPPATDTPAAATAVSAFPAFPGEEVVLYDPTFAAGIVPAVNRQQLTIDRRSFASFTPARPVTPAVPVAPTVMVVDSAGVADTAGPEPVLPPWENTPPVATRAPDWRIEAATVDSVNECLDTAVMLGRMMSQAAAHQLVAIDQARQRTDEKAQFWADHASPSPFDTAAGFRQHTTPAFLADIALRLRITELAAYKLMDTAEIVLADLPATFASLLAGRITLAHVTKIAEHAKALPKEAREAFEEEVLPIAEGTTVGKTTEKARTVVERLHPTSITDRTTAAVEKREVWVEPDRDGMATLTAFLPAEQALGIYNKCTEISIHLQGPTEQRTLTQLRADVFADLLINGHTDDSNGIKATVLVTVPVLTLLGHEEEPGWLNGYGPIAPDTARHLTAGADGFYRVLVDPITLAVLDVGRKMYQVTMFMRLFLQLRDQTCRFPGCHRNAKHTDADHVVEWQHNGITAIQNLQSLCPKHHAMKSTGQVTVTQDEHGIQTWTTTTGYSVTTYPNTLIDRTPLLDALNTAATGDGLAQGQHGPLPF